jgi:hypothetical protein
MDRDLGLSLLFLARSAYRRLLIRLGRMRYRPERRYVRGRADKGQAVGASGA